MKFEYVYRDGKRYYSIDNKEYVGVTSVTRQISSFKNSRPGPAAVIGTLTHFHILKKYSKDPMNLPKDMIWNVPDWQVHDKITSAMIMWSNLNIEFEFKEVECLVVNREWKYAGRVDFIGIDNDGVEFVGEIKTGNIYPEYYLQIAAYCKAANINSGYLIQLDLNRERNPERKSNVITMTSNEIDDHFEAFLGLLRRFTETNK